MAEGAAICCEILLDGKWKSWCRLCAKADDDAQYINVIAGQSEEFLSENCLKGDINLANAVLEFLRIHIKEDDKLPQIICKECHAFVLELIKFSERANKVQQIYDDLQNSINKSTINLQMLFENYGLTWNKDESLMPETAMERLPVVEEIFVNDFVETTIAMPNKSVVKVGHQTEQRTKDEREAEETEAALDDPFDDRDEQRDIDYASTSPTASSDDGCNNDSDDDNSCMNVSLSKLKVETKRKGDIKMKASSRKNVEDISYKYTCSICAENFERRSNFSLHMKRKHGLLNCRHCTSSFENEANLEQHIKEQHDKSWNCPHCEETFVKKGLRSNHIRMEHSTISITSKKPKIKCTNSNTNRSFVCPVCNQTYPQKKQRKQHMLEQHPDYQPNVCNVCGRTFKHKSNMTKHMERHGDKFICTECGKQLTCRAALNTHMLVHSDLAPHKCDVCGRAFKRHKALKYHLIAHTGLRPYPCDFCEKTFSTGSSCRLHKKTMHPKELAELEASGAVQYTKNVPKLAELKAVARTGTNFRALMSKQNGYAPKKTT